MYRICARLLPLSAVVLFLPVSVQAQSRAYEGGKALGETLFGSQDDSAYRERLIQNAEVLRAMREAEDARAKSSLAHTNQRLRALLESDWVELGLPPAEAASVASVYMFSVEQIAITERVTREGYRRGIEDAIAAYRRYDYQLANRLLIAARSAANVAESEASGQ